MKQFYQNGDSCYFIHRSIRISHFADKNGVLNMDYVKMWRDYLFKVDHVLRNETHFLFVETIEDVEVVLEE